MPLRMFKLKPGEEIRYRLTVPGTLAGPPLHLAVNRPMEGLSVELDLSLIDSERGPVDHGRVPLASGYLAVIQEVERQLRQAVGDGDAGELWFELHPVTGSEQMEGNT